MEHDELDTAVIALHVGRVGRADERRRLGREPACRGGSL